MIQYYKPFDIVGRVGPTWSNITNHLILCFFVLFSFFKVMTFPLRMPHPYKYKIVCSLWPEGYLRNIGLMIKWEFAGMLVCVIKQWGVAIKSHRQLNKQVIQGSRDQSVILRKSTKSQRDHCLIVIQMWWVARGAAHYSWRCISGSRSWQNVTLSIGVMAYQYDKGAHIRTLRPIHPDKRPLLF